MIQRIQSIWLLLASALGFLTLSFSFYSGTSASDNRFHVLNGRENLVILVLTVLTATGAFIAIFLFKKRRLQFRITMLCLLVSILLIVLYFLQVKSFIEGNYALWAIFSLAMPICFFLAARGIRRDEKLLKSLDRIR
jgi:hypothetical protein